jgi:hypothetical protein
VVGLITVATVATTITTTGASAAQRIDDAQQIGPLVTETSSFQGAPRFSAPSAGSDGADVPANRAATLAAARAAAVRWYLPAPGATATVRPLSDPGLCLTAGSATVQNSSPVTLETCTTGDPAQQFTLAANTSSNNPLGTGLRSTYNDGYLGLYNTDSVMRLQSRTVADRIPTIDEFVDAFTATLDRIDVLTRTAHLSGVGTPGATVFAGGINPVTVGADGTWSMQVSGLALGPNEIELTQFDGDVQIGAATITADLRVDALTFQAVFGADRDTAATASGLAHPGAEVRLFAADGSPIGATVTADATTGAWSTPIPAPDAGGPLAITAAQFIDGIRDTAHEVTRSLDYGQAVTVTTPSDGAPHAGGALDMTGSGEPGSAVEVRDRSTGDTVVGSGTVFATGRWTITTAPLDRAEHVLHVVQRSKGANTTEAEVTINPGETGRLAPITLAGPSTVTPGVDNVFTGTAEPGASYEVLNVSGTPLVPGSLTVDASGRWTFTRPVDWRATEFTFVIRQTKDGITETSELFRIAANSGFDPVTVTTQTVKPGESNTFTGTGPKGAEYQVLNASGAVIVPGTHTIDADGGWSFDRAVSTGQLKFDFKLRITVDGSTYTTKLFTVSANTR